MKKKKKKVFAKNSWAWFSYWFRAWFRGTAQAELDFSAAEMSALLFSWNCEGNKLPCTEVFLCFPEVNWTWQLGRTDDNSMTIINLWTGSEVMLSASYEPSAAAQLWRSQHCEGLGFGMLWRSALKKIWLQYTTQANNREVLSLDHPLEQIQDLSERDTGLDCAKRK